MTIKYDNVTVSHGEHIIMNNISFEVKEGEMFYLIGPVGSGKTSLMQTIYGELAIKEGDAQVLGRQMNGIKTSLLPSLRREMGIVRQDLRLMSDRTIHHNLDFALRATDWKNRDEREARIREVLAWVGLEDKADKFPWELSGGQQQCVCIARAALNRPKLILADEPTGQLDSENGEKVMAFLDEIRRQNNSSVIVSTHNMQWLEFFPGTVMEIKFCEPDTKENKGTFL